MLRLNGLISVCVFLGCLTYVGTRTSHAIAQTAETWHASGLIVDEDGKPMAGAILTPSLFDAGLTESDRTRSITTDSKGQWHWSISENPNVYCLRAVKPGFAPAEIGLSYRTPTKTTLTTAPSVQGYVVDSQDREVEGATVAFVDSGLPMDSKLVHRTTSDNRGWFHLVGAVEPTASLRAWTLDRQSGQLHGFSVNSNQSAVIEVAPPVRLELQMIDAAERPIAGAVVRLKSWNRTGLFDWEATSDTKGSAIWNESPQGLLAFHIECAGYYPVWKHVQVRGPQRATVQMHRIDTTNASVVDDETGESVQRFVFLCTGEKTNAIRIPTQELLGWNASAHLPREAMVGDRGNLPLTSIPFFDFVDVEVCALGFNRYKVRLDHQTDLSAAPELRLKHPNTVSNELCRLVDSKGRKVANAIVMYAAQGGITIAKHSDPIANQLQWPYHIYQQFTDQDGNFRRNARPEFEFVSAWTDQESFLGLSRNLTTDQPIEMQANSRIECDSPLGRSEPFCRLSVRQSVYLDRKKSHAQAHFYSPMEYDPVVSKWYCDKVPAGEVSIVRQIFDPSSKRFRSDDLASLSVLPGSQVALQLRGTATIHGQVTVKDEKWLQVSWECKATTIREQGQLSRFYRCNVKHEGRFQLEHLPAGDYMIEFIPVLTDHRDSRPISPQGRVAINVANPIRLSQGESIDIGNVEIAVVE